MTRSLRPELASVVVSLVLVGCSAEHVVGAVAVTRNCAMFPPTRSIRIDVVSDEPDVRVPRAHGSECLDVPEAIVATNPMQVMVGLASRGFVVDEVSEDARARVRLLGFASLACADSRPDARTFCALSTRPLDSGLSADGNTLFLDFSCDAAPRTAECFGFGPE